jgi:hypothetical protein
VLFLLSLVCAPAAHAADVTVVGTLFREASLPPGGHSEGMVLVRNNTGESLPVRALVRDYAYHADGTNDYADPGTLPRSNATWIHLQPDHVTIPPKETARLYYTVAVPTDGALAGTYWSLVMIEPDPDRPRVVAPADGAGIAVNTVIRYGLQIATHVGTARSPALAFAGHALERDGARVRLAIDVDNGGDDLASPLVWAEVFTPDGVSVGRFEAARARLYPGCSARFRMDMSDLPPGTYTALAVADAGGEQVYGSQFSLELE